MNDTLNTNKLNIAVIFGGASSEYEVSLMSAVSILRNINTDKYNIYKIGITKKGEFLYYTGDINSIEADKWQESDTIPCIISPDRTHHGMITFSKIAEVKRLDCVFPVLHGKNGEDGTIQGLLSLSGIPYVGCDTISSACCMDKAVTKTLLDNANIPNSKWESVTQYEYRKNSKVCIYKIESRLGYPCFVKPANAGSSVGISKAVDAFSLKAAIELAFAHDKKVIIEEFISGIELECAVLGNEQPIASILGEIEPCNDFYDYDAKYLANKTKTYTPARIDEVSTEKIRVLAVDAYKALGCEGLARVDFFLTDDQKPILNEINTIPGFTSISMYPKLFEKSGIPYTELIDRLIELGINRK